VYGGERLRHFAKYWYVLTRLREARYERQRRITAEDVGVALFATLLADSRLRYVLVGGATSALYYLLFVGGWATLHAVLPYPVITAAAHLTTALLAYPLYRTVVFAATGSYVTGFLRFYTVFAGGLIASLLGLPLLVEGAGLNVLASQATIILLVPAASYLAHRWWTFRGSEGQNA
jgi:putative flippase GtrA